MIKKLIFALLLITCIYAQTAVAPAEGDGSESNPYHIATLENLYWIVADTVNWDKHYIQTEDINAYDTRNWLDSTWSGYEDYYFYDYGWKGIGNLEIPFTGSYDGGYYSISNLYYYTDEPMRGRQYAGLFGMAKKADIKNVQVVNADIRIYSRSGLLVGLLDSSNVINCSCTGKIGGMEYIGGLIGLASSSNIQCCYTSAQVDIYDNHGGGIAASIVNSTIENCYSKSSVIGMNTGISPIAEVKVNSIIRNFYCTSPAYTDLGWQLFGVQEVDCFWQKPEPWPDLFSYNPNAQMRTLTEMKTPWTYLNAGWDFVIETENGTEDIWDIDTSGVINGGYPFLYWEHPETTYFTSIDDIKIPDVYKLYQNYPNPFNPITTISYQLPASSNVELAVYDISGRKINQWSYINQAAGTYEITWNGKDQHGNPVPSGVYIYRMMAGEFVESKKMVLLK